MPVRFQVRKLDDEKLSVRLVRWLKERVPETDQIWISDFEYYKCVQVLAKGRFAETCKFVNPTTTINVAANRMNMEAFNHWSQDGGKISTRLNTFIEEFCHLQRLSLTSDRIVHLLGISLYQESIVVVTEYLPRGSVKDRIMQESLNEDTAIKYLQEGLEFLHGLNPPIVHREIKASSLLLNISDRIKLSNFGLMRNLAVDGIGTAVAAEISPDFRFSLLYVAPEVLKSPLGPGYKESYTTAADVWALGCTFIEMLIKNPPHFEYLSQVDEIQREIYSYAKSNDGNALPYTSDVLVPSSSRKTQLIVDNIFESNPRRRPNTARLKHNVKLILEQLRTDEVEHWMSASTSSEGVNDEREGNARKSAVAETGRTVEVGENGGVHLGISTVGNGHQKAALHRFAIFMLFYSSRILYFLGILSRSVCYLLSFLVVGLGALCAFLLLSFFIVKSCRYLIALYCDCNLMEPQYFIISGILVVLLFALFFSCCMVALGEYKFRMANRTLRRSRFFVSRPEQSARLCGVTVLPGKDASRKLSVIEEEPPTMEQRNTDHDEYYYDAP